jgi:glycosyltransferase involved in cell wall biosynthesis
MKIYIQYSRIFDLDGKELTIGGIQTYLINLAKLLINNDYEVEIYQCANHNWNKIHEGIKFIGIDTSSIKKPKEQRELVYNCIIKKYQGNDILIFGTDSISIKNTNVKSISIQHGIYFDYLNKRGFKLSTLNKLGLNGISMYLERRRAIKEFLNSEIKVCVDYNFLNWIRTFETRDKLANIYIIPNFTHINSNKIEKNDKVIKILFARRFMMERGVYILEEIINRISSKYSNIQFTIAGSGELEAYVKENIVKNNKKVSLIQYGYKESLEINSKHDIALVPSYGSEGTSLSLLEAMTSKCIPIATNVGGMTNIILDSFNGFLVNPKAEEFVEKIELLIKDKELRVKMQNNAKVSADEAFSYKNWSNKWLDIIKKVK